jgi:hypothetical protein
VRRVTPALRPEDAGMALLPWIDPENFNPGYLMRGMHLLPKRGDKREWQHTQDYWREKNEFPTIDLDDPAFVYGPAERANPAKLRERLARRPAAAPDMSPEQAVRAERDAR